MRRHDGVPRGPLRVAVPDSEIAADPFFVQLLDRIRFPDGSYYEMEYFLRDTILPGGIHKLRVRHGGEMRWTYTPIAVNSQNPEPPGGPGTPPSYALGTRAYAVSTKETRLKPDDVDPLGTWTYDYDASTNLVAETRGAGTPEASTTEWFFDYEEGDRATNGIDDLATRFGIDQTGAGSLFAK